MSSRILRLSPLLAFVVFASPSAQSKSVLAPADLYKLQSVGDVQLSPDGTHVAYSVTHNERPGPPVQRHVDSRARQRHA